MNDSIRNEETIDLKRIFITYLKKWRVILISALLGALVLGLGTLLLNTVSGATGGSVYETTAYKDLASAIEIETTKIEIQELYLENCRVLLEENNDRLKRISTSAERAKLLDDSNALVAKIESTLEKIETSQQTVNEYQANIDQLIEGKSVITSALIGAFLGMLAVGFITLMKYLLNKTMYSADCVRDRYGLTVLSNFHISNSKYHSKLDLLLEKLAGEVREINMEAELDLLAAKLQVISKEDKKEILLCGPIGRDTMKRLCDGINLYIDESISVTTIGNPVYNADATTHIKNASVVLVGRTNVTPQREFDKTVELLHLSNAEILGVVLI